MELKNVLCDQLERELEYQKALEVGSEDYNASIRRTNELEDKIVEIEKHESERKDSKKNKLVEHIIEGVKVGSGVILPIIGIISIIGAEKEITFRGALKDFTRYFLPRKF